MRGRTKQPPAQAPGAADGALLGGARGTPGALPPRATATTTTRATATTDGQPEIGPHETNFDGDFERRSIPRECPGARDIETRAEGDREPAARQPSETDHRVDLFGRR